MSGFNDVGSYRPKYGDRYLNYADQAGQQQRDTTPTATAAAPGQQTVGGGAGSLAGPGQAVNQTTGPAGFTDENPFDMGFGGGGPNQAMVTRGSGPASVQTGYGFRDALDTPAIPEVAAAGIPEIAEPEVIEQEDPFTDENPYEIQRDDNDNPVSSPYRSSVGYNANAGKLPDWMPSLPGADSLPFPGVTGALLGGVSGFVNNQLDDVEAKALQGEEGYMYNRTPGVGGGQRYGVTPGLVPGTQVYTGPTELKGFAVNQGVEGNVQNAIEHKAAVDQAIADDLVYTSDSGNTYFGMTAENKRDADEEAASRGYSSAVTDSSGKAVRDQRGDVVVAANSSIMPEPQRESDNDSGGGGGGGK